MRAHARSRNGWVAGAILFFLILFPACASQDDDPPQGPGGEIDADFLRNLMVSEFASIRGSLALPGGPPVCCTLSPEPLSDTDTDGVPDLCIFSYDEVGCAWQAGDYAFTTWGEIVVTDPGATLGYNAEIVALNVRETSGDPPRTITRSQTGTRTVLGTAGEVTLATEIDLSISSAGADTAFVHATWTVVFTADAGESIEFGLGRPYPAGSADINGELVWKQGGATFSFDVLTVQPLRNDPQCLSPFAVGGEVWAQLTGAGGMDGHLQMRCTGCAGEIEFEWLPAR